MPPAENNFSHHQAFFLDSLCSLTIGTSSSRSVKEALDQWQRICGERERRSGRRALPIADLRG